MGISWVDSRIKRGQYGESEHIVVDCRIKRAQYGEIEYFVSGLKNKDGAIW